MALIALRKTWRICGALFPLIYYFSDRSITLFILLPFVGIFIIIEILRFYFFRFNENFFHIFRYFLKEHERKNLLSTTWSLLSTLLVVVLFAQDIAIIAMLFFIFGDAASAVFGLKFGRTKIIGNRSLEGSLAFFITCLIIATIMNFTKVNLAWPVMVIGALAATLSELLPLPLDDNFTIALFSGIIMTVVSKVLG